MLACHPQRREHFNLPPTDLPSPSPSHINFFDHLSHTTSTPSPSDITLRHYFNSLNDLGFDTSTVDSTGAAANDSFMNSLGYNSPAIRVQQSTPVPQLPSGYDQSQQDTFGWNTNMFGNGRQQGNNMGLQTPMNRAARSHQRAPSTSSAGSDFSSASNNVSNNAHATSRYSVDESSGRFANSKQTSLPTPTQTPTQESFLSPSYQNFNSQSMYSGSVNAHDAMRNVLQDSKHQYDDDYSISSYGHNSPATPHGDDYDESLKLPNDLPNPKFDVSDYSRPMLGKAIPRPQPRSQHLQHLSPQQMQSLARSQSPSVYPAKPTSPFRPTSNMGSPHQRLGNSQLREQHRADASQAMRNYQQAQQEPKTISPKEALLDYDNSEDSKNVSLFENDSSSFGQQYSGNQFPVQFNNVGNQGSWNVPRSLPSDFASMNSTANFNFSQPSVPQGIPQIQFPQHYRPAPNNIHSAPEPTPEFPAHLTSMESSASEAGGPDNNFETEIRRPESTRADRGTYSCTYRDCPQRFDTPQKLQKHKREGHRQNVVPVSGTPGIGSNMPSAELMVRNSQAGPHKCERINPTTGKKCMTEFSRPYDLTRHEDTIHNIRKQKVRCELCIEEKTFSRNDALTRHRRVVHPEFEFPGKHRKRGGAHD